MYPLPPDEPEQWRTVPDFPDYEVSTLGRVRSKRRVIVDSLGRKRTIHERILKAGKVASGHMLVAPNRQSRFVHRLVMEAFVGPRPFGKECCHGDGNPANNRLSNLRWGTRSDNVQDALRHGTMHNARKTHCPYGHPYSGDNLYSRPGRANRACKACMRRRQHQRKKSVEIHE